MTSGVDHMKGKAPTSTTCSLCKQNLSLFERAVAYRKDGMYVCHGCSNRLCRKENVIPFARFTWWKFGLKVFFGVSFMASMAYHDTVDGALFALAIGLGLLAWAIVPLLLEKSKCDSIVATALADKAATDSVRRRCKSCGAIGSGKFCEYCGAPFEAHEPR